MSDISDVFVRQYVADVKLMYQQEGSRLRETVLVKTGVIGESTTFPRVGKGMATTKGRHGVVTPMNVDYTPVTCTLTDHYAPDYVDKLDEFKISHNEREALLRTGASAIGRKVDDIVFTAMDATSTTFTLGAALTRAALLQIDEVLTDNDVPDDNRRFAALTPRAWSQAMTIDEFASGDFTGMDNLPFARNTPGVRYWNGIFWMRHTGLPGKGTATASCFGWHMDAVGLAEGVSQTAEINYVPERVAHLVNNMISVGACLRDDTGVVKFVHDDTAVIATS